MSAPTYLLAEGLAEEFDADLVYQCHGIDDVDALRDREYAGPRRVVAVTEPLIEQVASHTAFNREDVDLVRLGVAAATEPTCFSKPGRCPTLVASAPLVAGFGVDMLLHAVSQLRRAGHTFLAFLLGTGRDEEYCRQLARELDLTSHVVFATPEGDPIRAMSGADVFVQPYAERSVSSRALHALAQGIAVAAVGGGVNDVYRQGVNAQVAHASTSMDLAAAIERLLRDPPYARSVATGAIAHMRKHHTMSGMAEGIAGVYRRLASHRATFRLER
jgi:glycosyltransferase involved in cell wall biosynthesis